MFSLSDVKVVCNAQIAEKKVLKKFPAGFESRIIVNATLMQRHEVFLGRVPAGLFLPASTAKEGANMTIIIYTSWKGK